jgi:pyruvate formate lyase activating enzyme
METPEAHPARWWHLRDDGRVQCDLCPRDCALAEGQRGLCFVRARAGDQMVLTTWGRSSGFCVDPIEKKPLAHFHPGSSVLSFGTAGCNLACKFCQNWEVSKSREMDLLGSLATPEMIARTAVEMGCKSVAFTYNDPVIFLEYAVDTAAACRAAGIATIAVTAGYIHPEPRTELFAAMDAANVDLKGFTEGFYRDLAAGHLEPVKETLRWLVRETDVWTEITTLLIPGHNDSDAELRELTAWVAHELGPEVPLHFSAFHPAFRLLDAQPTPLETLRRARRIGLEAGLRHVYTGNLRDPQGEATTCAGCGAELIRREGYRILTYELDAAGRCRACGAALAGRFGARAGTFGSRRIPVEIG